MLSAMMGTTSMLDRIAANLLACAQRPTVFANAIWVKPRPRILARVAGDSGADKAGGFSTSKGPIEAP